jgi:hypothetical protein
MCASVATPEAITERGTMWINIFVPTTEPVRIEYREFAKLRHVQSRSLWITFARVASRHFTGSGLSRSRLAGNCRL